MATFGTVSVPAQQVALGSIMELLRNDIARILKIVHSYCYLIIQVFLRDFVRAQVDKENKMRLSSSSHLIPE